MEKLSNKKYNFDKLIPIVLLTCILLTSLSSCNNDNDTSSDDETGMFSMDEYIDLSKDEIAGSDVEIDNVISVASDCDSSHDASLGSFEETHGGKSEETSAEEPNSSISVELPEIDTKPVEDELSEDVSEEDSGVIIESSEEESSEYIEESSETESIPEESSAPKDEPSESEPEENSETESEPIESSEESSEPIEESSETEPVISKIPSVPSEDDPIENDPVEESSETESSDPVESIPEESEPADEDPFAKYHVQINTMSQEEAEALIEECILMYINKYRVEEGKCEMTMLNGKSRAFAKGRSVQLTKNFAHDYDDRMSLANELEYGVYEPEYEETIYDWEKKELIYTGNIIPAQYKPYGGEAISKTSATEYEYIDDIAESSAAGIFKSKAHWEYIGGANSDRIAIGVTLNGRGGAYICYLNMDAESAALYD